MEKEVILKRYKDTLEELKPIQEELNKSGKLDLRDDNIYVALSFISKINGLRSIFSDEFIADNNLGQLIDLIDKQIEKMEDSSYTDKGAFYQLVNVVFPQLQYRYGQIAYRYSLPKEEQDKLIITAEYQVYLYELLKYYLEQKTTPEVQANIKEILSIINLYKVITDKKTVALGSEIAYIDTVNNEVIEGKIVIDSHANVHYKKFALKDYRVLFGAKKDDVVCIDFSTSFFVRILEVKNEEEKPTLEDFKK